MGKGSVDERPDKTVGMTDDKTDCNRRTIPPSVVGRGFVMLLGRFGQAKRKMHWREAVGKLGTRRDTRWSTDCNTE